MKLRDSEYETKIFVLYIVANMIVTRDLHGR